MSRSDAMEGPGAADGSAPAGDWPIRDRQSFVDAVAWGARAAIGAGARRMLWADPDFGAWPLDDRTLLDDLGRWLRQPQRRLVMLANDWSRVRERHPRFTAWRRDWAHAIDTLRPQPEDVRELPTLLIDDQRVCVRMFDIVQWRGRARLDEGEVRQWQHEFESVIPRSTPDFPVTSLGL